MPSNSLPDADFNLPEMKTKSPSCPSGRVHMYVCVLKQLSVYTQSECAVYEISWGGWAGGILSTLKIKQKGFCPKKGFCPSWKVYRRDSVHLVKMSGRDYVHLYKNEGSAVAQW